MCVHAVFPEHEGRNDQNSDHCEQNAKGADVFMGCVNQGEIPPSIRLFDPFQVGRAYRGWHFR